MNSSCPCYNCPKRTRNCHDTCEGFLEWKRVDLEMKEDVRRQRRGAREARDLIYGAVQKTLKGGYRRG